MNGGPYRYVIEPLNDHFDAVAVTNPHGGVLWRYRIPREPVDGTPNRGQPPMTEVDARQVDSTTEQRESVKRQRRADAEKWLDKLLAQDREGRIRMASSAVAKGEIVDRGRQCFAEDHAARLESMTAYLLRIGDTLADLRENCIPEMSEAGQVAANAVAKRLAAAAELFYP